jgi:hypothetical protein
MPPKKAKSGAAKAPGKTDAPGKPAFPGAAMPFTKGGGRKKRAPGAAKPKTGGAK